MEMHQSYMEAHLSVVMNNYYGQYEKLNQMHIFFLSHIQM